MSKYQKLIAVFNEIITKAGRDEDYIPQFESFTAMTLDFFNEMDNALGRGGMVHLLRDHRLCIDPQRMPSFELWADKYSDSNKWDVPDVERSEIELFKEFVAMDPNSEDFNERIMLMKLAYE